ncbi:MAG: acyl-ACP thioesterase [Spirochaetaceae bacterium]|jgi:acyl-ACP thioesterase|nr:acyl-ACP thioesterase [Spirochaetaceae bacterium]
MDIWQETGFVRFADIDRSDRITIAAVFASFQEAAINHAEHLGAGREVLAQCNQAWILSRFSLIMDHRPHYREPLIIRTWPRGTERLFAVRAFTLLNEQEAVLVRATSSWLVIDTEKRRIVRPQTVTATMPLNEGIDALAEPALALAEQPDLKSAGTRTALYSDIDYNGHVNNVRYIQWIADISDPDVLESVDALRFDINYLNELKIGQCAELFTAEGAERSLVYAGRHAGQTTFRARLRRDSSCLLGENHAHIP